MKANRLIEEGHPLTTYLNCVQIFLKIVSVKTVTLVFAVTTELRISTTQKSTRQSFAKLIQIESKAVNTVICVRLRTTKMSWPSTCYNRWIKTSTSLYSTTKRYGVRLATKLMQETSVSTHTTGKISVVNPTFTNIYLSSVLFGSAKKTRKTIKTDVH